MLPLEKKSIFWICKNLSFISLQFSCANDTIFYNKSFLQFFFFGLAVFFKTGLYSDLNI